jgi:hypothetical protein
MQQQQRWAMPKNRTACESLSSDNPANDNCLQKIPTAFKKYQPPSKIPIAFKKSQLT